MPKGFNLLKSIRKHGIFYVCVVVFIFFAIASDAFLSKNNLMNVARQVSMLGITAVGMTCVILTSGIDLTVGSVLGLSGTVCAKLMVEAGMYPALAVVVALIVACLCGALSAFLITSVRIPPLIATLGLMGTLRGVIYILCGGLPVYGFTKAFKVIGQGYIGIIPVPVIIMVVIFIIGHLFLNRSKYGRYIYGLGGNEEAARLSGVSVRGMKYVTYMFSSFCAGIAGIVMLSRLYSAQPTTGAGFEMNVITAVVLGGISIAGGEGKLSGVVAGVIIIGILTNGMILLNIDSYWQMVVQGLVLLMAVGVDQLGKAMLHKSRKAA
ncbi:MAG: ABC transporter permease [Spirochaetales bacterium]|nr:ABC transporter permease [Spirochaetales bacterium]